MKMLHYMRWHSALIILAGMPALSACVNEEYDLSKDIDTDLTVLKNISMPVGSIGSIAISDILTLDDDSDSVIRKDENGDFVFAFTGQTISAEPKLDEANALSPIVFMLLKSTIFFPSRLYHCVCVLPWS